jgi:Cu(I)/Ag(I) efflux system membrane fusion protein
VRAVLKSPIDSEGRALASGVKPNEPPLVIPVSAPLITGKRALVYVELKPGTYQGREIVLGPRVGDLYVVREGLREGERVVTHGNFKIDSSLQILARPSMMNPAGGSPAPGHHHGGKPKGPEATAVRKKIVPRQAPATFKKQLTAVTTAYYAVHRGLSRDKLAAAKAGAQQVLATLGKVQMGLLKGPAHLEWMKDLKGLRAAGRALAQSSDIASARRHFSALSNHLIVAIKRFGLQGDAPAILFHCTMAFGNKGADWIQAKTGVENPYFGSEMFRCGDRKQVLSRRRNL